MNRMNRMEKGREEGNEREDSSYWVGEIFFLFFFFWREDEPVEGYRVQMGR